MRWPATRINFIIILLAAGSLLSQAQNQASPGSTTATSLSSGRQNEASASPKNAPNTTDTTGVGASTANGLDYLFNRKAQDGTVAKDFVDTNSQAKAKAAAADATGNRMEDAQMRARFESFLSMDAVPKEKIAAYMTKIDKINQLLRNGKTFDAWRELYGLADFQELDAGLSGELANRVNTIWDADNVGQQIAKDNQHLQGQADTASRNADMISDEVRDREIEYQRRLAYSQSKKSAGASHSTAPNGGVPQMNTPGSDGNQGSFSSTPDVSSVMGKLQLTDQYLASLEARAKIKLNEMRAEKVMDKAKADFGEYISSLYQAGCYRHVVLAAGFYRGVFDQGDYPVATAQQVNTSLQAVREVQANVGVFNNQIADNEVSSATDSLQSAFMINEFDPSLLSIPLAQKKKVAAFLKCLSKMQNVIEARDFANLEDLLSQMKKIAPDFDATKPMAIVNAVKLQSQLRLGKAKLAAQQGDLKTAMDEFQAAAEAWPGNPDLKDKALTFFNTQDVQNQALTEFDRLAAENNYRAIFEKQLLFAPAMKDDAKRQQQLKDALAKVQEAETSIQKANLMTTNGDVYGAWETVEIATQHLPDDLKLNALRGQLAGKGAEFVSAINKAKDSEAKNEFGYSLTWYAIAQRIYPASMFANQGIERLKKQILEKQG